MKREQLDFSIIIPTYNRSEYIGLSIQSALRQKGVSFEIIICDDCSSDNTYEEVKKYTDKRIKYVRNSQRIGISLNFQKCFLLAKGTYTFTLGDDDFILNDNTLLCVKNIMEKEKAGLGKIGGISYDTSIYEPYQTFILSDNLIVYKPKKGRNILADSVSLGLGFFSGLTFNNNLINKEMLLFDHDCYIDHMCHTYNKAALNLILRHGAVYIPDHFIVARLSLNLIPKYFDIKKHGRLFLEDPLNQAKTLISEFEYDVFKKKYISDHLALLPSVRYYTNTGNYLLFIKHLLFLEKFLLFDINFYQWSLLGLLPKKIIKQLRSFKIFISKKNLEKFLKKYNYWEKIKIYEQY